MPHPLDHPVYSALTTCHGHFAEGNVRALRYRPDISPFAAAADDGKDALDELALLIEPDSSIVIPRVGDQPLPRGIVARHVSAALQMVTKAVTPPEKEFAFLELGDADAPEMLDLALLTKPGPFVAHTHLFGGYIGIRHEGRLVAMAGHRLQVPGFTEVSALCTHPDFRGRGYGSFLLHVVATRISGRGETPFLHAFTTNVNAIRLYEQLGFVARATISVNILARA